MAERDFGLGCWLLAGFILLVSSKMYVFSINKGKKKKEENLARWV